MRVVVVVVMVDMTTEMNQGLVAAVRKVATNLMWMMVVDRVVPFVYLRFLLIGNCTRDNVLHLEVQSYGNWYRA